MYKPVSPCVQYLCVCVCVCVYGECVCHASTSLWTFTHLHVPIEGAGALGAVRGPVGLLVDGGQAWRGRGGVVAVALYPRHQDAVEGGLGDRVHQQRRGESWGRRRVQKPWINQHESTTD